MGGGVEPPTKFSKRGKLDRISIFRGVAGKEGWPFSGGLQFLHKNKLKSEILLTKKVFKNYYFFVITKFKKISYF